MQRGKLLIIGFGPGSEQHMTFRAKEAILEADSIIGYSTYVDLIRPLITTQDIVRTGMTEEVSRAQEAVRQAETGKKVAVISSGDSGVYGMAGLVYEVLIQKGWKEEAGVEVEIIPGISAINSCGSLLGAPIMHDACTISLSDHLTPWDLIKKRVDAAAEADFVIALYNPRSGKRTRQIVETQKILLKYRSPDTPVGLVKSAYREREQIVITDLEHMLDHEIGMLTTVIIGNNSTFIYDGKMITPRGYQRKYTLNETEQQLKPHERLKKEAEPWALHGGIEDERQIADRPLSPQVLAEEALSKLVIKTKRLENSRQKGIEFQQEDIFEFAVSPGIANKKITPQQLAALVETVGEGATLEYTPDHLIKVSVKTSNPSEMTENLGNAGFLLLPTGDVVNIKACDFCDGEKADSIPQVELLQQLIGGISVPKQMNIGFNGCGMACYSAPTNDIGIIYRKKGFDLFLGAKTTGRNAHVGQLVAEGLEGGKLVDLVVRIIEDYKDRGLPNERFHKFFKRVQVVEGFYYKEVPEQVVVDMACGD
ncbi:precorrin-3B C(17)-methyltransferase [Alkalihalobacterium chitinilyticum]|uniref:Precorrin-3B C(17)-methyltransferase n=1 Tax=Alkalihalobacterium chitinilyticum TaxID=2980103 RepID=A0ABT5VCG5_9BACI|nr:precorrin-3B C(17)-methyltransferase [Alkalihalobacterium chitinilyticum]MDE5412168.1 precorrin-3B C(17)-methyltransferase [Alkalihalobacterium chitinilyticum]